MKKILLALSILFSFSIAVSGEFPLASEQTPYGDAYIKRLPILESITGVPVADILAGGGGGVSSVSIYPGAANGTIQYNVNGGESEQVAVTGLGSAAYTASSDYATAAQGSLAASSIQVESDPVWSAASGGIESRISALEQGGGGGGSGVTSWNGQTGAVTFSESDPSFSAALPNLMTKDAADQTISGTVTFDGKLYASSIQTDNILVTDYVEIANSLAMDGNINMTGAGRITNLIDPVNDQDASTKKYVDSQIDAIAPIIEDYVNTALIDYAAKPDNRTGYVMPPQLFDYVDSNTFTLDAAPKFILEGMILSSTSFTYLQEDDWEFSGNQFTVKNVTLQSGDKVKVTYAIQ